MIINHEDRANKLLAMQQKFLQQYFSTELAEVAAHSLFPAGKLFRSQLICAMADDCGGVSEEHLIFATAIEFHHTYTLIHDDLPAMDNDDYRRGRMASHKQFNEWKAILAGDALAIASLGLLAKLPMQKLNWLLKFFGYCTGAKGLIYGQYLDLSQEKEKQNFKHTLKIHTLKTARLIQLSLVGSYYLKSPLETSSYKRIMQMGEALGILFQLIDDFIDFTQEADQHEKEINPFFLQERDVIKQEIIKYQKRLLTICDEYQFENVKSLSLKYITSKLPNDIYS